MNVINSNLIPTSRIIIFEFFFIIIFFTSLKFLIREILKKYNVTIQRKFIKNIKTNFELKNFVILKDNANSNSNSVLFFKEIESNTKS